MKLLLLASYFTPEITASSHLIDSRNEAFVNAGFQLVVIAPTPTRGISKETIKLYKNRFTEELYEGKITVIRFRLFQEGKNTYVRAFRYFLSSIIQFYKSFFVKNIDIIFVASTPPIQGVLAALVKKVKKVPFVYSLQDIFPDSLLTTDITNKDTYLYRAGRLLENFTYRNADKIIVISEGFKKNLLLKGVPESKIKVVYNWVDEKKVIPVKREQNILFDRYNLDRDKFYVTYNGTIGLTQNMDLLIEVAKMFIFEKNIHFIIMGEGAYKDKIEKIIKSENITNVSILPYQPYEEISHVFSLGDVGLVISKENVGENSVPSKTWSIMSAARPVVASFDEKSDLQDIITNNKTGMFVKAGDKIALYNVILHLFKTPGIGVEMGRNGRTYILNNLTREIGTSKYVEVIKSVINNCQ